MQGRFYFLRAVVLSALFFLFFFQKSQAQCPGCVVTLPPLPADTVYLSDAPDGETGVYYDNDISFRMPKTTTPVPNTPGGLSISKISIIAVVNMPPGLAWQANQTEFDPGQETDGCVKFCGTPLQPGLYEVEVFVTAEVLLISQSTSFTLSIYIAPAGSTNDGFSMQNSSGCGDVTVDFENNVPSNGNPGYSYYWDFGNNISSSLESPGAITYSEPGNYEVNFEATIDTFGYQLTTIKILEVGCGDVSVPPIFNGAPDLYIKIKDPAGDIILQTSPVSNTPVPFAFNVNLPIEPGNYSLEVRDEDTFGSETCGTVNFTQTTAGVLMSGDLDAELDIIHPIFTVTTTDTVRVFAVPDAPLVQPAGLVQICEGDEVELAVSNFSENLQWYQDTTVLVGDTSPFLSVSTPGQFWVEYTSADGCKSISEEVEVTTVPLPFPPAFHNQNNLLVLNDSTFLPADYSLQWSVDGVEVPGETGFVFCATTPGTSLYTLTVTNNATGCTRAFSLGVTLNPNFNCLTGTDDLATIGQSLKVFPNPTTGRFTVTLQGTEILGLSVMDATGRMVWQADLGVSMPVFEKEIDLSGLPAGVFFLKVQTKEGALARKVLKRN